MRISDWSSDVCSSDLPRSSSRSSHHMGLKLSLRQLITRRTREAMSADMPIEASDVPRPDSGGPTFCDQPAHVENGRWRPVGFWRQNANSGKRLPSSADRIVIFFPHHDFPYYAQYPFNFHNPHF